MRDHIRIGLLGLVFCLASISYIEAQVVCTYTAANDLCEDAFDIGNSVFSANTCCGNIEGINLCGSTETGVWYYYDQSLSASLVTIENLSIAGGISVEFYSGDCSNLTLLDRSDCSGFSTREFEVPNCSGRLYIHVSTTEDGCGDFNISATDIQGCDFADNCMDITPSQILTPVADGVQVCASSCLNYSCISTCTDNSVWFRFDTDDLTTAISLAIDNLDFDPIISVYRGIFCSDLDDLLLCEQVNPGEFIDLSVTPDFTYYVEVSLGSGNPGAFDICINAIQDYIECSAGEITVTRGENPMGNPNGPYCPGETVTFCYDLEFYVDTPAEGNGCQWLQGIVPVVGGGWDLSANDLQSQSPLNWGWFDDVDYNVDNPVLALAMDAQGNTILEYGPGGLSTGDILPGGWFFVSNGTNPGCTNDGHPDNMWGVNSPCGQIFTFSHCFDLTARSVADITECDDEYIRDLSVTLYNFADGETGCYTSLACSGDTPVRFAAQLDCSNLVTINATGDELCSGDYAEVPVWIDGGYEIPLQVEVVNAGNTTGAQDWIFETGSGFIPDQIFNNGNSVETITYQVSFYDNESECNAPTIFFDVLVHPEFSFEMDTLHIICEGESQVMTAPAGYDDYAWYNAETNEFIQNGMSLETDTTGYYRIEITEDFCTATEIVHVQVNERLPQALAVTQLQVCDNYIGTLGTNLNLEVRQINGVEGIWYDENDDVVSDPTFIDFTGAAEGSYVYTFETTSALFPCPDTLYELEIIVEHCECPLIDIIAPSDFCAISQEFDLNFINAGSDPGYWTISDGPDVTSVNINGTDLIIYDNTVEGVYSLTYTLNSPSSAPLCSSDSTVQFNIYAEPEALIEPSGLACNVYTGTEFDYVDLDDYNLSGSSGIWSSPEPGISIGPDNVVQFTGMNPQDYVFYFNTDDAQSPCVNMQYTTVISLLDCSCPDTSIAPLDAICLEPSSIDLSALQITSDPGVWSIESGPSIGSMQIIGDMLVITDATFVGDYVLRFSLTDGNIGPLCDTYSEIVFTINQPVDVNIVPSVQLCNEYTGTLADTIDLDNLINTTNSGNWSSDNGSININSENVVRFTGEDVQSYTFRFTTDDAIAPCQDMEYMTEVNIIDCSCPNTEIMALADQCIDDLVFELDALKVTTEDGLWSIESGPDVNSLDLTGSELRIDPDTEEGSYTFRFTLTRAGIGPLCDMYSEFTVNFYTPVSGSIIPELQLCNEYTGTLQEFVDLDDLLTTSNSGSWFSDDPSIIIDSDNVVNLGGEDIQVYSFYYMTDDAQAPCLDEAFYTEIELRDCSCPSADISPLGDQCIEVMTIDLNTLELTTDPGEWNVVSGTDINSLSIVGDDLMIDDNTEAGEYTLRFSLTGTNIGPDCITESEISFNLSREPFADILTVGEACNEDTGTLSDQIDLDDYNLNSASGQWTTSDPDVVIDGDNVVEFISKDIRSYSFQFTTDTAQDPCMDQVYELQVELRDCACPSLAVLPLDDQCIDLFSIDLEALEITTEDGLWSLVSGPDINSMNIFGSELQIDDATVEGEYVLRFSLTGTNYGPDCDTETEMRFNIYQEPSADIQPQGEACNEDTGTLADFIDLDDYNLDGASGNWTSMDLDVTIDSDNRVEFISKEIRDYIFVFTTDTAQDPCLDQEYELSVSLRDCSCPSVELAPIGDVCVSSQILDLNDYKITQELGEWSISAGPDVSSLSLLGSELSIDENSVEGLYTLSFELSNTNIGPDCPVNSSVDLLLIAAPEADIQDQAIACNIDTGAEGVSIDLDDMNLSSSSGTWQSQDLSINIDGDNVVSFESVTPGSYRFVFTTDSADFPCLDQSYELNVTVRDCSCPNIVVVAPDDFCQEDQVFDLSQLIVEADAGEWSLNQIGSNSASLNAAELVITDDSDAGSYILSYTLLDQNIPPDCTSSVDLDFNIFEEPQAQIIEVGEACNNYIGSLDVELDLDDYFISGDQGSWISSSGMIIINSDNRVDFTDIPAGVYDFVYRTSTAVEPCEDEEYILSIDVTDCQCPLLELQEIPDLCTDGSSIDLSPYLNSENPGSWSISPDPGSDLNISSSVMSFTESVAAGTYTLSYAFDDTNIPSLCNYEVSVEFEIIQAPIVNITPVFTACNSADSGFAPVEIDLDDFVSGAAGNWVSMSPMITIGSGSEVSFEGVDPDEYHFIYSSNTAVAPCNNVAMELVVSVEDCVCPIIEFEDEPRLCDEEMEYDLNDLLSASVDDGSWIQISGPENLTITSDRFAEIEGSEAGLYYFEFTLDRSVPIGCDNKDTSYFEIVPSVTLDVEENVIVCNQFSSLAPHCIDLTTMVTGAVGIWEAPSEYDNDFSNITEVCFEGYEEGDQFVFRYTTTEAQDPCLDKSGELLVEIMDCSCPIIDLLQPDPMCNDVSTYALYNLVGDSTVSGEWIFMDGPEEVQFTNDSMIVLEGLTEGHYLFNYVPDVTPASSCPQYGEVSLSIMQSYSAGSGNVAEFCQGEDVELDLYTMLEDFDLGGDWSETGSSSTAGGSFDAESANLSIMDLEVGEYEFMYQMIPEFPCPPSEAYVQIIIHENPIADAGEDNSIKCNERELVLGGELMSIGSEFEYIWTELNTGDQLAGNSRNPMIDIPGLYQVQVININTGCMDVDEVLIEDEVEDLFFDAEVAEFECYSSEGGSIMIFNQSGGNGDYVYSINGGSSWTTDPFFDGLDPGTYSILMQDSNGCEQELGGLEVLEPVSLNVWLGDDVEIEYSEDLYTVELMTDAEDDEIVYVIWEMDGEIICEGSIDQCYFVDVDPFQFNQVCVNVVDINGCEDSDCMTITELIEPKVYIPNVFNPTLFDNNGMFFVQSNEYVSFINSIRVFDRWGGIVFERMDVHEPNNPDEGWDGYWMERIVQPGVFTYHVIVEDVFGEEHSFAGEVTLIR